MWPLLGPVPDDGVPPLLRVQEYPSGAVSVQKQVGPVSVGVRVIRMVLLVPPAVAPPRLSSPAAAHKSAVNAAAQPRQRVPNRSSAQIAGIFACLRARLPFLILGVQRSGVCRPYSVKRTVSRPICEVKPLQATSVLRWGTTWESVVPQAPLFASPCGP